MTKLRTAAADLQSECPFILMGSAAALGKQAPMSPHVEGPICDTLLGCFFRFLLILLLARMTQKNMASGLNFSI